MWLRMEGILYPATSGKQLNMQEYLQKIPPGKAPGLKMA
jgi:hypothetical protein